MLMVPLRNYRSLIPANVPTIVNVKELHFILNLMIMSQKHSALKDADFKQNLLNNSKIATSNYIHFWIFLQSLHSLHQKKNPTAKRRKFHIHCPLNFHRSLNESCALAFIRSGRCSAFNSHFASHYTFALLHFINSVVVAPLQLADNYHHHQQ